jgi:hypothetical protein
VSPSIAWGVIGRFCYKEPAMPAIDLPQLFQAIAQLAFAVLVAIVPVLIRLYGPAFKAWLEAKEAEIRSNMTDNQRYLVDEGLRLAVEAAEQLKLGDAALNKKEWAVDFAAAWLKTRGITLDLQELDGLIEAEVWRIFGEENKAKAQKAIDAKAQ